MDVVVFLFRYNGEHIRLSFMKCANPWAVSSWRHGLDWHVVRDDGSHFGTVGFVRQHGIYYPIDGRRLFAFISLILIFDF